MCIAKKYKLLCCGQVVCALFCTLLSYSQTFSYKIFTPADGLPEGSIGTLFKDSSGYLWIGSCGGLTRFDGKKFVNYGLEDGLPGICNNIALEDKEHQLWGVSFTASNVMVTKFGGGKFIAFPFAPSDSVSYVFSLIQSPGNKIWAATTSGMYELNGTHWKKVLLPIDAANQQVRCALFLNDGSLLLNTYTGVWLKKPNAPAQLIADTAVCDFYNVMLKYGNKVLVVGGNRLFIYDAAGLHPIYDTVVNRQRIYAAAADAHGRIWVAADRDGIIVIDKDSIEHFGIKEGLPHVLNIGFCEDREGNMWLGNFKGLIRLRQSYIQRFGKEDGLAENDVRTIFKTRQGNLFFGHSGSGFSYWNKHVLSSYNQLVNGKNKPELKNIVMAFAEDEQGSIYFTTNNGKLYRYQNNQLENYTSPFKTQTPFFNIVVFSREDASLYVTSDSVLFKLKMDTVAEAIPLLFSNHTLAINQMYVDRSNHLWISCTSGDVGILDIKKKVFYKASLKLENAVVHKFLEDKAGNIWIATGGKGILKLEYNNNHAITPVFSLTKKDGLANDIVQNIAFDSTGYLWAVCSNGITRINLQRRNEDGHFVYQNFGAEDGLVAKSYADASLLADDENKVWLGTIDGVFRFNTATIFQDTVAPKIQIEKVALLNDSSGWKKYAKSFSYYFSLPVNPVLPHNKNDLTVYYNAIAFANNDDIVYAYKLEGLDTGWSANTASTYASFINLSPGSYTFRVKARRKNFRWSEEARFSFIIRPPFWETWWFRILTIVTASAVLIYVFRLRINQIRKRALLQQQMQELELKALKSQMNPHFIYNAMNSIQSLIMADAPENAVRYLGKFAKLLRGVLDNSDKLLITVEQELSSLHLYIELEALRLHKNFDYTMKVADNVSPENEMIPPLVLQPFVENALWHGLSNKEGVRTLQITVNADEQFLIFKITDNGIGRSKAAAIKSNTASTVSKGLNITQRRLLLVNETASPAVIITDLYDAAGVAAGTAVELRIKRQSAA